MRLVLFPILIAIIVANTTFNKGQGMVDLWTILKLEDQETLL